MKMELTNKQFCKKYGITMSELARRANVGRATLYDLDKNRYKGRCKFKISYARKKIEEEFSKPIIKDAPPPRKGIYVNKLISFLIFLLLVIIMVLA